MRRSASISTLDRKGMLLLVADFAASAQFQPPQMAIDDIKIVVPAPQSAQAFEFSPQGKLLMTLGRKGVVGDNESRDAFNGVAVIANGQPVDGVAPAYRRSW